MPLQDDIEVGLFMVSTARKPSCDTKNVSGNGMSHMRNEPSWDGDSLGTLVNLVRSLANVILLSSPDWRGVT